MSEVDVMSLFHECMYYKSKEFKETTALANAWSDFISKGLDIGYDAVIKELNRAKEKFSTNSTRGMMIRVHLTETRALGGCPIGHLDNCPMCLENTPRTNPRSILSAESRMLLLKIQQKKQSATLAEYPREELNQASALRCRAKSKKRERVESKRVTSNNRWQRVKSTTLSDPL